MSPDEVVHACPPDGSGLMPCCGKTPLEAPYKDRLTTVSAAVTCKSDSEMAVVTSPGDGGIRDRIEPECPAEAMYECSVRGCYADAVGVPEACRRAVRAAVGVQQTEETDPKGSD